MTTQATKTAAQETDATPPDRIWGQHTTSELPRDPFPDHRHHLGSSIAQTEADPNGSHEFRVAGAFTVENDGELPLQTAGDIETQTVRLVNQAPETLAISTLLHPKEVAFAPELINVEPSNWVRPFGQITSVLSLALELLGYSTAVPVIGPASLAISLLHTYMDGNDESLPPGVYQWSGHTAADANLRAATTSTSASLNTTEQGRCSSAHRPSRPTTRGA